MGALGAPWIAFSLISQGWISTQGVLADGGTILQGVWRYLCYFTVLTNALVVAVLARAALRPSDRGGVNAPRIELMAVTSILFVGVVYNALLASQWDPQGLQKYNDDTLHIGAPLFFAVFWLFRARAGLRWRDAAFAALWPLGYSAYGLARGAADGFYPYFFMNPTTTPWPGVLANMAGLIAVFLVAATILVGFDRLAARVKPKI